MLPRLPDIASSVGFEIRLAGDNPQVDFGVSLHRSPSLLQAWREFRTRRLAMGLSTEAWCGFEDFLENWCTDSSVLYPWIPFIFLEVDADNEEFTPCIFTSFDWPITALEDEASERERSWKVADTALDILTRSGIPARVRENVRAAFHSLPAGGRVVHAGAMLGRDSDQVRLSIAVPSQEWKGYLDSLGLDGAWYEERIEQLSPQRPSVHFECDIANATGAKVGVVLAGQNSIAELIQRALSLPRTSREKLTSIRSWEHDDHQYPPFRSTGMGVSCKTSHLKIDTAPETVNLKAYLSAALHALGETYD